MVKNKEQISHLGVYAVITNAKNQILLIKKSRGPYKGMLDLPGGGPEFHETFEQTLEREVMEETGLQVTSCKQIETIVKHVDDYGVTIRHTAILYFAEANGEIKTDSDGSDSNGAVWIPLKMIEKYKTSTIASAIIHKVIQCQ